MSIPAVIPMDADAPVSRDGLLVCGFSVAQVMGLLAIICALVQLCLDPLVSRYHMDAFKYMPLGLALLGQIFHLVTCPSALRQMLRLMDYHWTLMVLAVAMLSGTAWAAAQGIEVTFRPQALSLTAFFVICHLALAGDAVRFARAVLILLTIAAIYMFVLALTYFPRAVIHENLYLFAPTLVFAGLLGPSAWWRNLTMLFMALFAVIGLKNTTFIIAATGIYVLWVFNQHSVRIGARAPIRGQTVALLVVLAVTGWVALDLIKNQVETFSSGNTEFRTFLYTHKWGLFLNSPMWGDVFSTTPNVRFTLFTVGASTQFLPAHSDVIDILAHGGLLGIACLAAGLWRIGRDGLVGHGVLEEGRVGFAARASLLAIITSAVVSASFNPVLTNPANGFMFWSCFATLAALSHRQAARREAMQGGSANDG